ncbi:SDR family NAD(P)-dependent oxidoreductase [Arthrobacter sp. 179]|uniref:SDR family NAD(P)-dependent oxidoreductase n=1 Tax=Arthrobacter sp. 179 TaxID=3457734 RepID=UPI0040331EA8
MGLLDHKVALITGGAQGMGASHVRKFVEEGARVVITDILVEKGQALADELGDVAAFVELDVTQAAAWDQVIARTESTFGPVDILVNNAGIDVMKKFVDFTEADVQKMFEVNFFSQFHGMQKILPSMQKAGGGSIVNISSDEGLRPTAGNAVYSASKFAVTGLTKAVAQEYAEFGIRVNTVHPGAIKTPGIEPENIKKVIEDFMEKIPMKRIGDSEEVSNLVAFVASDRASYSTGVEFIADGGIMAT